MSSSSRRPPLNRGQSMPIYFPRDSSDGLTDSFASLNLQELPPKQGQQPTPGTAPPSTHSRSRPPLPHYRSSPLSGPRIPETSLMPSNSATATRRPVPDSVRTPVYDPAQYPTPPSSNGPHNHHQTSSSSYFPPYTLSRPKYPSAGPSPSTSYAPPPMPLITTPASSIVRSRPSSSSKPNVTMSIESTMSQYILTAPLGPGFTADGITIAARKENALVIIADRWDQEDCHHEWQVQFGRDGDMSSTHASFENGVLRITVRRLLQRSAVAGT